jgi:hypothetical protein
MLLCIDSRKTKKSSASSPLEKRLEQKGNDMKKLSGKQLQMLERLTKLADPSVWIGATRNAASFTDS